MTLLRNLPVLIAALLLFSAGLNAEVSTATVTAQEPAPAAPAVPAAASKSINTAISDLNYKIETLRVRYNELSRELDGLRTFDRDIKRELADRQKDLPDPQQIERIQQELSLVRSELAQLREDMTLLGKRSGGESHGVETERKDVLHSPWLSVAALGIAFLALIF